MKQIDFNDKELSINQIDKVVRKTRGFVINTRINKVLLVHYAGLYMLPGGFIENGETELEALKREILEESGIEVDIQQLNPFLLINSYDENYFDRKSGTINRLTQTFFFRVVTLQDIDETKKVLSESEKEKNHSIEYVDLNTIKTLVETNPSDNPKRKQFDREILTALDELLKIEDFESVYGSENHQNENAFLKRKRMKN